jgi:uncharacterized protein YndB with AHSA1/START domain
MKPQVATATAIINAPAETVYNLIADYRHGHPRILPKEYFLSLDVEEGGFGAGTRIHFTMRLLGQTKQFHARITEPEPGRLLVETDINTEIPTSFRVEPIGDGRMTRLTIATKLKGQNVVESFIAKRLLQKVYRRELELVASVAEEFSH